MNLLTRLSTLCQSRMLAILYIEIDPLSRLITIETRVVPDKTIVWDFTLQIVNIYNLMPIVITVDCGGSLIIDEKPNDFAIHSPLSISGTMIFPFNCYVIDRIMRGSLAVANLRSFSGDLLWR